ncbi:MAG: hypothetical protein AAFX85_18230, partial [Pseudomonadota bacterium]
MSAPKQATGDDPLVLIGASAVCSLGLSLAETMVAVHAGCRRLEHDEAYPSAADGHATRLAKLTVLDDALPPWQRVAALGSDTIRQAHAVLSEQYPTLVTDVADLPVLMSLPPSRPSLDDETVGIIAGTMAQALPAQSSLTGYCQHAHTGFIDLLAQAEELLREGKARACLVVGADSGIDLDYVHWLETLTRLKSPSQPFGFSPGEGAACCVVTLASVLADEGASAAPDAATDAATSDTADQGVPL